MRYKTAASVGKSDMVHKSLGPDEAKLRVLDLEEGDPASGVLEGYASVFGNVDSDGDIVMRGAFAKTLKERLKKGAIKLFDSHRIGEGTAAVIGVVEDAKEDEYGLWFRAKFSAVQRAQEIRTKIREGVLNALSFGFDVLKAQPDENAKARLLKELRLYEISVVAWGANPKAAPVGVKAEDDGTEEEPVQDDPPPASDPEPEPVVEEPELVAAKAEALQLQTSVLAYQNELALRSITFDLKEMTAQIRSGIVQR